MDRHVVELNERSVHLPHKQFELLTAFMEAPGRMLDRRFLLERVWGIDAALQLNPKTVDLAVARLRSGLGGWGKNIASVEGYGYQLDLKN